MARKAQPRPSIRDVAALAGVSYQTVSRVINEPQRVRPATAQRVNEAIAELGYRPSKAARSLVTRDSMTIGVVAYHGELYGPHQMTLAIDEGARARGYATATVTVRDDSDESLAEAREHLLGLGVDGVVIIAWTSAMLELARTFAAELPTCVIAEGQVPPGIARAHSDHFSGAHQATSALRAAGRRRIAHLSGPVEWLEARTRIEGWKAAAGAACGPLVEAGWGVRGGYLGVDRILEADDSVDAIFASNDQVAVGALRRLQELGLDVPGRVALVGYDDLDIAPYLRVPLASVRQPFAEVGSAAAELLFEVVEGGEPGSRTLPALYVPRASAGIPASG